MLRPGVVACRTSEHLCLCSQVPGVIAHVGTFSLQAVTPPSSTQPGVAQSSEHVSLWCTVAGGGGKGSVFLLLALIIVDVEVA